MSGKPPQTPPTRTIRFFADFAGTPLWGPVLGPLEPERIGLDPALTRRLREYDAYHSEHAPVAPHDAWPEDAATRAWQAEADALPHAVAEQIGPGAWVVGTDRLTVHHAIEAGNPAAAAAFEALVADEAAASERNAALVAEGGRWTAVSDGGDEYRSA